MNEVAYRQKCTELRAVATMPLDRWPRSLEIMGVPVNVISAVSRRRNMAPARDYYRVQFGIPPRVVRRRAPRVRTSAAAPVSAAALVSVPAAAAPVSAAPLVSVPAAAAPLFTRTFGVEIECYNASRPDIIRAARAHNQVVESQGYNHTDSGVAKIVSDCSLSGANTNEVVLPPANDFAALEAICAALNEAGAKVNRSCGLHVHIDARNMHPSVAWRVIHNYRLMYDDICHILAPSRINSRWAMLNPEPRGVASWCALADLQCNSRYYAVNLYAYKRHKTIEFRQHQGSVDFDKISRWVEFLQTLVRLSEQNEVLTSAHISELRQILARPVAHGRRLVLSPAKAA